MLTIGAMLAKVLESQCHDLVVTMQITDQDAVSYWFMSGASRVDSDNYHTTAVQNICAVSPVSAEIDPIMRGARGSDVTVTCLDDGSIRHIMQTVPLKNSTVKLYLTTERGILTSPGLAYTNLWGGIVADIVPHDGLLDVVCQDALAVARGRYYYGLVQNQHPLELAYRLLIAAGVHTSMVDADTLTFEGDSATRAIGHFIAKSRWTPAELNTYDQSDTAGTNTGYNPPATIPVGVDPLDYAATEGGGRQVQSAPSMEVGKTLDDIALMCFGTLAPDETGEIKFKAFDVWTSGGGASVANWTADDIVSIEQDGAYGTIVNEVQIPLTVGRVQENYVYRNTDAQDVMNLNADAQAHTLVLDLPLACQDFWLRSSLTDAETSNLYPGHQLLGGMCGTRATSAFRELSAATVWADVDPWALDDDSRIGTSGGAANGRTLYLKLDAEIISATVVTLTADVRWDLYDVNAKGKKLTTHSFIPTSATVSTLTRGVGETVAAAHTSQSDYAQPYYDVTIARHVAKSIVDRCAYGMPRLSVETSFAQFAVQLGDLVMIEDPLPVWWKVNGCTSANAIKWEVVSKEFDLARGTVRWGLAFAHIATAQSTPVIQEDAEDPDYDEGTGGAPMVDAGLSTTTNIKDGVWTLVPYDTTESSTGGNFDETTSTFTTSMTGDVRVQARATFIDVPDGSNVQLRMKVVEPDVGTGYEYGVVYNNNTGVAQTIMAVFDDITWQSTIGTEISIEAMFLPDVGGDIDITNDSEYTSFRVRIVPH